MRPEASGRNPTGAQVKNPRGQHDANYRCKSVPKCPLVLGDNFTAGLGDNFTPIPSSITNDCLTGTVDGPGTACRSLGETASVIGKDTFQGGIQGFGVGSGLELE